MRACRGIRLVAGAGTELLTPTQPLLFYGRARRIVNERGWEADWRVYAPPTRGKVARAIHPEPAVVDHIQSSTEALPVLAGDG